MDANKPSPAPVPALDQLATPLAWADRQGRITGVNPAFPRWIGVGVRRLVGQPLAALELEGDALARFLAQDEREVLRLHRIPLGMPGEAPRHADGWLTRTAEGWLLEAHPADDSAATDPAQALPAALQAALKGMAHELRNPLAGLKGAAQLLSRRAHARADAGDEHELIELIGAEIDRLSQLVEQLLSPAPQRPHAPLNIHAVLERVLRLAEAEGGWTVRLQRDYDPSIPEFDGDADRLTQAIWNLVRNALQAGASAIICAPGWKAACTSASACTRARCGWRSSTTAVACPRSWPNTCSCRWSAVVPRAPAWAWPWPTRSRASTAVRSATARVRAIPFSPCCCRTTDRKQRPRHEGP